MLYTDFELAPGEVAADRYDPADDQQPQCPTAAAELTEWDLNPWFQSNFSPSSFPPNRPDHERHQPISPR